MNKFTLFCAAAAIIAPAAAYAQETTSTIQGSVTAQGAPVAGAEVTITHVDSGTTNRATTDNGGTFSASGLRIGGPYTIEVNAPGYPSTQVTDITTEAGQPYTVPIELGATTDAGGAEVVITASRLPNARRISQGPVTVLNQEQIQNVATVNRDIRDLSRRDPFARLDDTPGGGRAISFAGQNARYNRFSVDGVAITDNFGLNPDGLPSRRSPIPLDAIGQFQAKVAPYDVRDGNFQGGAINIVLRSGTNNFQGTAFAAYTDDYLTGKETKPGPGIPTGVVSIPSFKYENFGVELSGPIIKDRLFFMIAGERIRANTPIAEGPFDNNSGTAIPFISQAQVDQISAIAQTRYGYETGGVLQDVGDKDDRLVARIDANLSDEQRLSITYTYAKDAINLIQNTFPNPTTGLGLASNAYVQSNRLHTGVVQLNSDWTDEFSTEIRAFYKDYKRGQDPVLGRGFAQFQVCDAPTSDRGNPGVAASASINCATGFGNVSFGPDISRQTNALTSTSQGLLGQARLNRDDHDLRVFFDVQTTSVFNSFLQRSAGDYYFDSIADFQAGNAQRFRYGNAIPSLVPEDAAANFDYQAYTFGAQDTWTVTDTLTVAFGVRYDLLGGNSAPTLNPNFLARYGFPNTKFIGGLGVLQPRFGFNWRPTPRISIRGGAGIFSGGTPDVYVSNSFANTGVLTNAVEIVQINNNTYTAAGVLAPAAQILGAAVLTNVDGDTIPTAANNYLLGGTVSALSPTNALDPDFRIPSQWRATLSAGYDADLGPLGDNWQFGVDVFYSAVRHQVFFTDLRVQPNGRLTPDGRMRYFPLTAFNDSNSDILLTNSKLGRSYVGVIHVDKNWDFGLGAGIAYTYQDIKDQNPATSSTAGSNYAAGVALDPNGPAYGIANDEVKHAFKFHLDYSHAFFGDYKTTFALFGESREGHPFSYTFRDPATRSTVFGTIGTGTRYLMYVPTGPNDPLVSYDTVANRDAFEAFIESSGLAKYRGTIAPRNAFNSKWFTRLDLHLAQELPGFFGKSRFQVFADVENFTNLINKNWGQIREFGFPYTNSPVQVACLSAPVATGTAPGANANANTNANCVQYRYTANPTGAFVAPLDTIYPRQSLYQIRVGVRFSF